MNWIPAPGVGSPGQIPLNAQGQPMFPAGMPQMQMPQAQAPGIMYPGAQGGMAMPMPQAPTYPQAQPPRQSFTGEEVLDGANIPVELRGRKLSDAMKIYAALAEDFLTRRRGPQVQNGQTQQQQNQPGFAQAQQPQGQPRTPQGQFTGANFQVPQNQNVQGGDPESDRIAGIVRQVVGEAVAPFQQQQNATQISSTLSRVRQGIPDFQQLEPEIMEAVKGASDESLVREDFWTSAADMIRGRRMRQAQMGQTGSNQIQAQVQPQVQNFVGGYPQAQMPAPQYMPGMNPNIPQPQAPRPQTNVFFSEAPTAPSPFQNTHGGATTLTQAEMRIADQAGMPHDVFAAWKSVQNVGRR